MKKCAHCGEEKDISKFGSNKRMKDGLNYYCKECQNRMNRESRSRNRELWLEGKRIYREKNARSLAKKQLIYYHKNKESISIRRKTQMHKYRDRIEAYRIKYYKENRKGIIKQTSEYKKNRCKHDVGFRLRRLLSDRIQHALRFNKVTKSQKTIELLGCTIGFYMEYLEQRFFPGMTWDNYGLRGWHIDHIRPCASFDLTDPKQQRECFNYKNTQPLWAHENYLKGAKVS